MASKSSQHAQQQESEHNNSGWNAFDIKIPDDIEYYYAGGVMCKVLDGLYISDAHAARNKNTLRENNISHIVCLESFVGERYPNDFKYLAVHIEDVYNAPLASILDEAVEFIHNAITKDNGQVLVHCLAGVSRSASVVIAYLIKTLRIPYEEAYQMTKQARPIIQPNRGFEHQLRMYEARLLGSSSDGAGLEPIREIEEV